jgi:hypothetical protein
MASSASSSAPPSTPSLPSPAPARDRIRARPEHDRTPGPTGVHRTAGRYRYEPARGTWWWSPELFELHGLPADTAEATTELLLLDLHPDDRVGTLAAITAACTEGRPFTVLTRIVRPDGRHRAVVLVGEPETTDGGEVSAVHGLAIDLTDCPRTGDVADRTAALEAEVTQMRAAMASRATIEQAKGILMLLTGCTDTVAFDLLTHISSHTHRKVRQVAESITESASGHARLPDDVRAIVRDACPPSTQGR